MKHNNTLMFLGLTIGAYLLWNWYQTGASPVGAMAQANPQPLPVTAIPLPV
jgi:hypothetical protein